MVRAFNSKKIRSWMLKKLIDTLFILAVVTMPNIIGAQQQLPKDLLSSFRAAVATCAAIVWRETDNRAGLQVSQFDAYVDPDGTVKFFGTPKEHFSFQKCMNEGGYR